MKGFGVSIYGKGGIGKSTVSANLSCALAEKGNKVLLIGCDPKHDTTRQIAGEVPTVTEYAVRTLPSQRSLWDIVKTGRDGILCVEAGGPKPGVGCAGKGIVTMFQILERLDDSTLDPDITVYDVLGDVVCGGFSVPMRPRYTDAVIVVTSGEPMSLYAANNILRGTLGFEDGDGRVAGLILNRRGIAGEDALVDAFSEAVGVPVIARLDRSDLFIDAERSRTPVVEKHPDSGIAAEFRGLADTVAAIRDGAEELFSPTPMTDEELDRFLANGSLDGSGTYHNTDDRKARKAPAKPSPASLRPRRIGKGGLGSIMETGRVTDIPIIVHGTDSCAISGFSELMSRRIASDEGDGTGDNITYSIQGLEGSIFGGCAKLDEELDRVLSSGDIAVVLSTCFSNMTGEDVGETVRRAESRHPGSKVVLIEASRTDVGFDAHMEVLKALAELVDPGIEPNPGLVTVVDDTFLHLERGRDLEYLDRLLNGMGLGRTRGFLEDCTAEDIRCLKRAGTAVLGEDRKENRLLRRILAGKGMRFMERPLPRGVSETVPWLEELGRLTGRTSEASELSAAVQSRYDAAVDSSTADLDGRRIAVVPCDDSPLDWMTEALRDAGALPETVAPHAGPVTGISDPPLKGFDLVIGDAASAGGFDGPCIPMPATSVSEQAQVDLLRRARNALRSSLGKGWMQWRDAI